MACSTVSVRYGAIEMTAVIISSIIYDVIYTYASSAGLVRDDIDLVKAAAPMIVFLRLPKCRGFFSFFLFLFLVFLFSLFFFFFF